MKGWAPRLALRKRLDVIWKWPIVLFLLRQLIKVHIHVNLFGNQSSRYSSDPARKVAYSTKWEIVFSSGQKHFHSSKTRKLRSNSYNRHL